MRKKYIVASLLAIGILLLFGSLLFAAISTASKNIIGGPGLPTFQTVFFTERNGLYSILASVGVVTMIAAAILGMIKVKK